MSRLFTVISCDCALVYGIFSLLLSDRSYYWEEQQLRYPKKDLIDLNTPYLQTPDAFGHPSQSSKRIRFQVSPHWILESDSDEHALDLVVFETTKKDRKVGMIELRLPTQIALKTGATAVVDVGGKRISAVSVMLSRNKRTILLELGKAVTFPEKTEFRVRIQGVKALSTAAGAWKKIKEKAAKAVLALVLGEPPKRERPEVPEEPQTSVHEQALAERLFEHRRRMQQQQRRAPRKAPRPTSWWNTIAWIFIGLAACAVVAALVMVVVRGGRR